MAELCSRHYLTYFEYFIPHLYHVKLPSFKSFPRNCSGIYCQQCRYSSPSSLQLPCLCNYLEKQLWKLLVLFGILLHLSLFWSYEAKIWYKAHTHSFTLLNYNSKIIPFLEHSQPWGVTLSIPVILSEGCGWYPLHTGHNILFFRNVGVDSLNSILLGTKQLGLKME